MSSNQAPHITGGKEQVLERRPEELFVRRPGLQPQRSEEPLYYLYDNAAISLFFSAISASIPEMEKQFIHSMRNFQEYIRDARLQKEVKAFIGQEAHHSNEHKTLNRFLTDAGLDFSVIERQMQEAMTSWKMSSSPKQQLAFTVCMEHFTGLMADFGMRKRTDFMEHFSNETLRELWAWHLIEEAEHKSVAFDLYQETVDDPLRLRLRLTMIYVTWFMVYFNVASTWRLLRQTGEASNLRGLAKGIRFLAGRRGFLTTMMKGYLDFYRSGFHPWDHDNRTEIEGWKARHIAGKY